MACSGIPRYRAELQIAIVTGNKNSNSENVELHQK